MIVDVAGILLMLLGAGSALLLLSGLRDEMLNRRDRNKELVRLRLLEIRVMDADRWLCEFSIVDHVTAWIVQREVTSAMIRDKRSRHVAARDGGSLKHLGISDFRERLRGKFPS